MGKTRSQAQSKPIPSTSTSRRRSATTTNRRTISTTTADGPSKAKGKATKQQQQRKAPAKKTGRSTKAKVTGAPSDSNNNRGSSVDSATDALLTMLSSTSKRRRTPHIPYQPSDVPEKILRLTLAEDAASQPGPSKTSAVTKKKAKKVQEKSASTKSAASNKKGAQKTDAKKVPLAKKEENKKPAAESLTPKRKVSTSGDKKLKIVKPPVKSTNSKRRSSTAAPKVLATKKKSLPNAAPKKSSNTPSQNSIPFIPLISAPPPIGALGPRPPFTTSTFISSQPRWPSAAPLVNIAPSSKAITKKKDKITKNAKKTANDIYIPTIPGISSSPMSNLFSLANNIGQTRGPSAIPSGPPPQIYIPPLSTIPGSSSATSPSITTGSKPKAPIKKRKVPSADTNTVLSTEGSKLHQLQLQQQLGQRPSMFPPPVILPFQFQPMLPPVMIRTTSAAAPASQQQPSPPKKPRKKLPTLLPRLDVTLYAQDPTFESGEQMPPISTLVNSRLMTRSILTKNNNALEKLIREMPSHMASFCLPRSTNISNDPLYYAVKTKNFDAIKLLISKETEKASEKLGPYPDLLIESESTGKGSFHMFGHAMKAVNVARGGKEGNDALLKDKDHYNYRRTFDTHGFELINAYFEFDYTWNEIKTVADFYGDPERRGQLLNDVVYRFHEAVWRGRHKLAGEIVSEAFDRGGFGFNLLHKEALCLSNSVPFTPFNSKSVIKKFWYSTRATPIHFAAINPDPYYLKTLLKSKPEYNILDGLGRAPVHFAAACSAPETLIYLLENGVNIKLADKEGKTPLYLAAEVARIQNVRVILKYQSMIESGSIASTTTPDSTKDSIINHANPKNSYCPIHIAVVNGHFDIVNELLDQGADPEKSTSAAFDKLTPAMLAARYGHLSILQLLINKGEINIEAADKKGRTALTHAVIDGQGHVVSFLLRLGVNNQVKDTSGNTLPHYAAAYGWYFIWKLLMQSGCPPNEPNDWKMTPLGIAFLKGHIGLVQEILSQPGVDVNSPIDDTTGQNLLLQTCAAKVSESFLSRLQFLIGKQNASCTAVDFQKNNALHYLVLVESKELEKRQTCYEWAKQEQLKSSKHKKFGTKDKSGLLLPESSYSKRWSFEDLSRNRQNISEAVKLVIKGGCDPNAMNSSSESPITLAFKLGCIELIELVLESGCKIQSISAVSKSGNTVLHHFIESFCSSATSLARQVQLKEFLGTITAEPNTLKLFQDMANIRNEDGYAALHCLLQNFTKRAVGSTEKIESSNYVDLLSFLLSDLESDVNLYIMEDSVNISTPLHQAVSRSSYSVESVQQLVAKSPDLNSLNKKQQSPLVVAINMRNEAGANFLVQAGADVNFVSKNDSGNSILILAGQKFSSDFNVIPSLVLRSVGLKTVEKETGNSVLHLLAMKPDVNSEAILPTVQKLISYGADVMLRNVNGQTPLHLLINERGGETDVSYDLEEFLIKSNPRSLLIQDTKGRIPLHYCFIKSPKASSSNTAQENKVSSGSTSSKDRRDNDSSSSSETPEPELIEPSPAVNAKETHCKIDPIELVALLTRSMKQLTKASESIFTSDHNKSTVLHYASVCGSIISISLLLTELKNCPTKSIDEKNLNGNTPFGLAIWKGNEGAALQFQQNNANFLIPLNTYEERGVFVQRDSSSWQWEYMNQIRLEQERELQEKCKYPILQEVIQKNQQGILHLMIEKLSSSTAKDEGIMKAIEASLKAKRLKLALKLLKRSGMETLRDPFSSFKKLTLFHTLAKVELNDSASELSQLVDVLLTKKISLSALDETNTHAIVYAALNWNTSLCAEFTRVLNINELAKLSGDQYNRTPFSAIFWKLIRKSKPLPDELKKWGAKLIGYGSSPNVLTNYPIVLSNYPGVGYLLLDDNNLSKVISATSKAYTPLIMAVLSRNYDAVKWLLNIDQTGFAKTVDVNAVDSFGRTALMYAVKLNDMKMVKLLLNHKSYDPDKDVRPWADKRNTKDGNGTGFVATTIPNLGIQDKAGWTVVHHLVSPIHLPSAGIGPQQPNRICFVNSIKILRILTSSIGFSGTQAFELRTRDTNETVLELAKATTKYQPIIEHLENTLRIPSLERTVSYEQKYEYMKIQDQFNALPAGSAAAVVDGNYLELNSNDLLKRLSGKSTSSEPESEGTELQLKPDPLCGFKKGHGVVLEDPSTKMPFDSLLTQVDISYGMFGLYNFYKMQINKQTHGKDLIVLFTRWGRVGTEGQYQKTPFPDEESAILEFKKIFRAKTGNNWEASKEFQPVPKKYRLVNIERRKSQRKGYMDKVKVDFEGIDKAFNIAREKFPSSSSKTNDVINLVRKLCLIHKPKISNSLQDDDDNEEYKEEFGLPHGLLDLVTLQKGDQLLDDIQKLLQEKDRVNKLPDTIPSQTKQEELSKISNSIVDLSEQYFSLIPVHGFSFEKIEPIFNFDQLRKNQVQIHRLVQLEFATKLLLTAQLRLREVKETKLNPYEYIYKSLDAKVELMDRTNSESQLILQYIYNTSSNGRCRPKVEAIYRVERNNEMKTLNEVGIGNRWLLWHGSRTKNMLSILHNGLQVVPLGSNFNGDLFGKGIYFADMFEKSSHYCTTDDYSNQEKSKFMFLCEVALGNVQQVKLNSYDQQESLQAGCNSLKTADSKYEPDPGNTIYWNGRIVPLGKKVKHILEEREKDQDERSSNYSSGANYGLDFNEYVIFDKRQVCLRYLVQFRD